MFSLLVRAAARRSCPRLSARRSLATVSDVPVGIATEEYVPPPPTSAKVPVREDHGLYAFFRKDKDGKFETLGGTMKDVAEKGGRAWSSAELRLKSFEDLHTLWYVLVRERNLLATQKHELRRLGVPSHAEQLGWRRTDVKLGMARIKQIMNERRLAYLGAVELAEKYKEDKMNTAVHKALVKDFLGTRREHRRLKTAKARWSNAEKRARRELHNDNVKAHQLRAKAAIRPKKAAAPDEKQKDAVLFPQAQPEQVTVPLSA